MTGGQTVKELQDSGISVLVDECDMDLLESRIWRAYLPLRSHLTACAYNSLTGKSRRIYLHRMIAERAYGTIPITKWVDHIDRNPFNDQRSNLRIITPQENAMNKGPLSGRYKGVSFDNAHKRYRSVLTVDNHRKPINLGYWETPEEAAKAYDCAALFLFGDIAYLNFPEFDYSDMRPISLPLRSSNTSGFMGVSFNRTRTTKPWVARFSRKGRHESPIIQYYVSPEEAARGWDSIARECGVEEWKLNFPNWDEARSQVLGQE